ncbi:protein MAINTENANCE OF MERISTEMS-like [Amaranthus tricolor]|uniref:protein MAINTENANCE OF MERISTEMS-like n=1 Tax=Amaranthus tricolor TaxID=29722 RepID=UPI0025901164|nr:protein MAINTENANCE OF MERISTEMS-like [Amaranthus tricolor]
MEKTSVILVEKALGYLYGHMLVQLQSYHFLHEIHSNALPLGEVMHAMGWFQGPEPAPLDWTIVRGHQGRFARGGPSSSAASERAGGSFVDNEPPRGRPSQSTNTDWLVTSPQPGGPTDTRLIPSYGGHIAKLIYDGSERTPPILECRIRKRPVESIIGLRDLSVELVDFLPYTSLGRLPVIMHQHIDSALISAFVERWQPDTNTFHMPWGEMTIMLHDVQRILGISIDGSLPAEPSEAEWEVGITNLVGEPLSELRRKGSFTSGCISVAELMRLCHRSHALDTQTTAYYMAVIGSTLLADKTRTGMRPHPIVVVNDDEQDVAWGAVTLAFLYRQLGMASRAGCKTIAGCLTLLQTWIYEYFPAFRPHPRRDDVPNTTRAEMWTPKKVGRELDRLISFRKVLDSMTETQVEWTPYNCGAAALLHEHPRTTVIGGITCFDVVEVYLPERALRQIGFVQSIPPAPMRPAKALRPAHGTYSVTFPSSAAAFVEAWSRFPYSGRLVEQGLRRATVPSETEPNYVEWFRVCSHPYISRDELLASGPGPGQSRSDYFAKEWASRFSPVARLPTQLADLNSRQRHALEIYLNDCRELYDQWHTE